MDKRAMIDKIEKKIRSANGTKRSFKMECRLLSHPVDKRRFEEKLSEHETKISSLSSQCKAMKTETSRNELFVGAKPDGAGYDPESDGDAVLAEASRIQDKTQTSLDNTKQRIAESKEVGMATLDELHRQREQINTINQEADRIESNLNRADILLKTFGKRMATDKTIQCFACVNVVLLVVIVIYAVVQEGSLFPQEAEPESPVGP